MPLTLDKMPQGNYRISSGAHAVELSADEYADVFYAVPLNSTALYRLLVDTIVSDAARSEAMAKMLSSLSGRMNRELDDFQKQVMALKP